MNLYVVRHGQTDWNVQGKLQGSTDIELNQTGIKQAIQTSELLKNVKFDIIYSSPLKRAVDTARLINNCHDVNIITDKRIAERGFGNLEGTKGVLEDITEYLDYEKNLNTHNVEPIQDVFNRIHSFLSDICNNYRNSNANILVVTHGGTGVVINGIINNKKSLNELISIEIKNCEVKIFENLNKLEE